MELSVDVDYVVFIAHKSGFINGDHIVKESKTGDTVQNQFGRIMRTDTKNRKIFHSERAAIIQSNYWVRENG